MPKKILLLILKYVFGSGILLAVIFMIANDLSPLEEPDIEVSTVVLAKDGEVLRQFSDENGVFRQWITLEELSPDYLQTLLVYEDQYFYQHFGVNPLASFRALWQWIRHGVIVSGSSTLTMQVSRLLYPHPRTIWGKVTQIFRALQLELRYTKEEILTLYINLAPMGGNIEGVGAASQRYFSKKTSELNLAESALLVVIPQRPSIYRPDRHLENATKARNKVLKRLVDKGMISEETYQIAQENSVRYEPSRTPVYAPLLAERLRKEFPAQHRIHSTIDYRLQRDLENFLRKESYSFPDDVLSGAILVLDNQTHEVRAYIGSVDMFDQSRAGFVDMVQAIRSPGSTLKPFAYGMALDYGIIHEASLLTDVPRSFNGYEPQNFDRQFRGRVPMYRALQQSLNVPVVQVFQHLTPLYFTKKMRDAGVKIEIEEPTISMILGGLGITLEEQVRLFSSFANNGRLYPLRYVLEDIEEAPQEADTPTSILSSDANWVITKNLRSVHPPNRLNSRKIAWKTGTSYGYRDGWAMGVSPDWTVGVWIGRADGSPNVGILAGDIAAPMLFDIFGFLPKDRRRFEKPLSMAEEDICWPSGRKRVQVPANECLQTFRIEPVAGKVPGTLFDAEGEIPHKGWPKLLSDEAIYFNQLKRSFREKPVLKDEYFFNGLKIITLSDESILFRSDFQLELQARGRAPFRWYLDGRLLPDNYLNLMAIDIGLHRLSVQDEQGNSDQIQFELRSLD